MKIENIILRFLGISFFLSFSAAGVLKKTCLSVRKEDLKDFFLNDHGMNV